MKPSFLVFISSLLACVIAGGARRGYELMFVWYAYKGETEYLLAQGGENPLRNRRILPNIETLSLDEFLDYTSRSQTNTPTGLGVVFGGNGTPDIDKAASRLARLMEKRVIPKEWRPKLILTGTAEGGGIYSYEGMLNTIARRVKTLNDATQPNAGYKEHFATSINAIQKVVLAREIDYENYRIKVMKKVFPNIELDYDTIHLSAAGQDAMRLNLKGTQKANDDEPDLVKRLQDWITNVYHKDTTLKPGWGGQTEGQVRLRHYNALKAARRAKNLSGGADCN